MKRIAVAVALVAIAACTAQEEAPVMDTAAAPAAAPAPEPVMDTTITDTLTDTTDTSSVVPPTE